PVHPHFGWWMHTAEGARRGRGILSHARPIVAADAERRDPVAGAAATRVQPRVHPVHREVVVGMGPAVADAAVVTCLAVVLAVAGLTPGAVLRGRGAMRDPEIRVVVQPAHPLR